MFLAEINLLSSKSCYQHLVNFKIKSDEELIVDGRGGKLYICLNDATKFLFIFKGKRKPCIYDYFPELEIEAKIYVDQEVMKKECSFNLKEMARFLNEKYLELSGEKKQDESVIRSEKMLSYDFKRWGIDFNKNSKKPFFEGHERPDVIEHRKDFITYFLSRRDHYYLIDDTSLKWKEPIEKPCVIIFHDESTFRSHEQSHSRWMKRGHYPFISKGCEQKFFFFRFIDKIIFF